jgi:plasmid maintenance system antidote protein VapI
MSKNIDELIEEKLKNEYLSRDTLYKIIERQENNILEIIGENRFIFNKEEEVYKYTKENISQEEYIEMLDITETNELLKEIFFSEKITEETLSYIVDYLGENHNFKKEVNGICVAL